MRGAQPSLRWRTTTSARTSPSPPASLTRPTNHRNHSSLCWFWSDEGRPEVHRPALVRFSSCNNAAIETEERERSSEATQLSKKVTGAHMRIYSIYLFSLALLA